MENIKGRLQRTESKDRVKDKSRDSSKSNDQETTSRVNTEDNIKGLKRSKGRKVQGHKQSTTQKIKDW